MFDGFKNRNKPAATPDPAADSEHMKHIAHAANQVTRFEATLARMYAEQHPNDPAVVGYHAATKNLDNLTDASIIRGHLRLLEQIGKNK